MKSATWITVLAAALLWSPPAPAANANLCWTPPTQNTDGTPLTDLAGYRIYAGCNASGTYELQPDHIDDPTATCHVYEGLPYDTTCYFVGTALNTSGVESAYSNEAVKTLPPLAGEPPGKPVIDVTWPGVAEPPPDPGGEPVMTIATEDFTAANGTALTTYNPDWALNGSSNFEIQDNAVTGAQSAYHSAARYTGTWKPDQFAEAVISNIGDSNNIGVAVRVANDGSHNFYGCQVDLSLGGSLYPMKVVGGTWSYQSGFSAKVTGLGIDNGDVIRIEAMGTTIRCYLNGELITESTDTSHSDGSPGITHFTNTGVNKLDSWVGGDFFFSNLTSGQSTSNGAATDSVTVPDDGVVYLSIIAANTPDDALPGSAQMTSSLGGTLGLTFSLVEERGWGFRRKIWLYRAINKTGSEQSGTVTISIGNLNTTYQEHMWSIDLATGVDLADPDDVAVTGFNGSPSTSLTLPDVGTPDAGDAIFAVFGFENAAGDFALDAALTELGSQVGGANVRSLKTGYDADAGDETPGASSSTSNYYGGIALIVNAAATGSTPTAVEVPWTTQPPAGTPIDWSNPLTEGLIAGISSADQGPDILGSGSQNEGSSKQWRDGEFGRAIYFPANSITHRHGFANPNIPDVDAPFTAFSVARTQTVAGSTSASLISTTVSDTGFTNGWMLKEEQFSNAGLGLTLSRVNSGQDDNNASGFSTPINQVYAFGAAFNGTGAASPAVNYVLHDRGNGTQYAQVAATISAPDTSNIIGYFVGSRMARDGVINDPVNAGTEIYLSLIWNRVLSEAELRSLAQNPWQIFEPQVLQTFVPSGGAPAGLTLDGSSISESTLAALLNRFPGLAATATSESEVAGAANLFPALAGESESESALTALLNRFPGLAGSTISESQAQALLDGGIGLAGSSVSESTLNAALGLLLRVSGALSSESALDASLGLDVALSGEVVSTSDLQGALSLLGELLLSGAITSWSDADGSLAVALALAGDLDSVSDEQARLDLSQALVGVSISESVLSANLQLLAQFLLTGSIDSESHVAAVLGLTQGLAGSLAAESDLAAFLDLLSGLRGSSDSVTHLVGALGLELALRGDSESVSELAAALSLSLVSGTLTVDMIKFAAALEGAPALRAALDAESIDITPRT